MAKVVVMPKLGYTQDEGTIAEWHKQVGDPVAIGDPFFDVHTDKSVITVEASCAGTLLKIALEPGNTVPVLTPVAVVGEPGEDADAILASHVTAVVADAQVEADFDDDEDDEPAEKAAAPAEMGELKLTPRAKKYMKDNGMAAADVSSIQGTGFQGGDYRAGYQSQPPGPQAGRENRRRSEYRTGYRRRREDYEEGRGAGRRSGSFFRLR